MTVRQLIDRLEALPDDRQDVLVPSGVDFVPLGTLETTRMKRIGETAYHRRAKVVEREGVEYALVLRG